MKTQIKNEVKNVKPVERVETQFGVFSTKKGTNQIREARGNLEVLVPKDKFKLIFG